MTRLAGVAGELLCPNCLGACSGAGSPRPHCGFDLSRLNDAPKFKACLERAAARVSEEACGSPCAIEAIGERVSIRRASTEQSFGRDPKQDVALIHARVAPLHAVAASLGGPDCWLADGRSVERTFVNREPIANFLLPLVMIAQIVFSVQIAAPDTAKEALEICYGEFHFHQCAVGRHPQGRRAERWFAETTTPPFGDAGAATTAGWLCGDCSANRARGAASDPDDDRRLDAMRPTDKLSIFILPASTKCRRGLDRHR